MFAFFSVLKQHVHWYFTQSIRKVFSNNKCRRKLLFRQRSTARVSLVLSQELHQPYSAQNNVISEGEVKVRITVHRQRPPQNTLLYKEKRKDY